MPDKDDDQISNVNNLLSYCVACLTIVHFFACVFVYIGLSDAEKPEDERFSWLLSVDYPEFKDKPWHYIHVFAYYWVFEVVSTVGYGEFSGSTIPEYVFTIIIEFMGVVFIAMLLGLMGKAIG